jgi:mono/diheme cytochrome c family protein
MKRMRQALPLTGIIVLFTLLFSACSLSLAEDITPPPSYNPPPVEPTAVKTVLPIIPPDPVSGMMLYADLCLACHGDGGLGDGPQAEQLSQPPAAIGSTALARTIRPSDWYDTITKGRVERMMPGFGNQLDNRQRWDVVAYTLLLSVTQEQLFEGQEIYLDLCLDCHGEEGRGDGSQVAGLNIELPDWGDASTLAQHSVEDLWMVITEGGSHAMLPYKDDLEEDQRWSVAAFIRTLSFASSPLGAPTPTPELTATEAVPVLTAEPMGPPTVTIVGQVMHAAGDSIPAGLTFKLLGFDGMEPSISIEAQLQADGSVRFEDVGIAEAQVYIAEVAYKGMTFSSDAIHDSDFEPGEEINLWIVVSDPSADSSVLVGERMHIFLDFSQPDTLQVMELFIISNPTDQYIVPSEESGAVLSYELPSEAVNLRFEDMTTVNRFVLTENGFNDTAQVYPSSETQILFAYDLPYTPSGVFGGYKYNLSLQVPLSVASAIVMLPSDGVRLQSDQLIESGQRSMEGVSVQVYTSSNLVENSTLDMVISGQTDVEGGESKGTAANLIIGLAGLVLALGGAFFYFRQRQQGKMDDLFDDSGEAATTSIADNDDGLDSEESLIDTILALDDQYAAGEILKDGYSRRRSELKQRLKEIRK